MESLVVSRVIVRNNLNTRLAQTLAEAQTARVYFYAAVGGPTKRFRQRHAFAIVACQICERRMDAVVARCRGEDAAIQARSSRRWSDVKRPALRARTPPHRQASAGATYLRMLSIACALYSTPN
jgi:hypothetical protein